MKDEFKKIMLAGIGSAAYTYEKASDLVSEFVKKGKLTVTEGKELSEELKRNIKNKVNLNKDDKKETTSLTKEDMKAVLKEMNFATKEDLSDLSTRLTKLENQVK